MEKILFLILGGTSILAACAIYVFRVQLTDRIIAALRRSPGIPFRNGVIRDANPNRLKLASLGALVIGVVFLVQAALRTLQLMPTPVITASPPPGVLITVAASLLVIIEFAGGFVLVVGHRAIAAALAKRWGADRASAPRAGQLIAVGLVALILGFASAAILIASVN
ncbi:hypothetical protein [Microbacterium rhizomatis]|uniref:Uncharacterized protein n=1 Tax=Microbacterium rhizomatis TaxID=1631477 RepID=A0A5J5J2A3_9MICO|nr:hypothetical protein [Microbacterium rhizomatis]KAA9108154.1 hypothetical protein F6B43_12165 [Microbacterium rhizomatis]